MSTLHSILNHLPYKPSMFSIMNPCGAVIMAAGRSRRMNHEKLALPFDEKRSFLVQILSWYRAFGCDPLIVVVNPHGEELMPQLLDGFSHPVKVAVNPAPEKGRFSSLQQALKGLPPARAAFIHNVDNPFADDQLLAQMLRQAPGKGFASPVFENRGGHPLLLMPDVIQAIMAHQQGDTRLDHFLKAFPNKRVETEDPRVLVNVNTPEDYQHFLALRQSECFQ